MHAMVLCAGFGTRLRPLTDKLPKPMVPLCGVPLLGTLLVLSAAPARATTDSIISSIQIDSSNSTNNDVDVSGTGTVVTLVSGGSIGGADYGMRVTNGTASVSGGSISGTRYPALGVSGGTVSVTVRALVTSRTALPSSLGRNGKNPSGRLSMSSAVSWPACCGTRSIT